MADEAAPWWPWALGAAVGGVVVGTVATLLWRASQAPAAASTSSSSGGSTTTTTTTSSSSSAPPTKDITLADSTDLHLALRPGTVLTIRVPSGALWMGTLGVDTRPVTNFTLTTPPLTATVGTPQEGVYNGGGVTLAAYWMDSAGGGQTTRILITDA